jgi:hypothetical protein
MMEAIENIALIALLLAIGVGLTWAILLGFVYFLESMND